MKTPGQVGVPPGLATAPGEDSATTDVDGHYEIGFLRAGDYILQIDARRRERIPDRHHEPTGTMYSSNTASTREASTFRLEWAKRAP